MPHYEIYALRHRTDFLNRHLRRQSPLTSPYPHKNLYPIFRKTTLDIQTNLIITAKAAAAKQRATLTGLLEEGLSMHLTVADAKRPKRRIALPVMVGKCGMREGIDPTSNRSLLDAMDQ